jgi:hypothetical protein
MSLVFPKVKYHPLTSNTMRRLLAHLKQQATVVKDRQLRKLHLTRITAMWKGMGLPPPEPTNHLSRGYQALVKATSTLEPADILSAYRICAESIGAVLEDKP